MHDSSTTTTPVTVACPYCQGIVQTTLTHPAALLSALMHWECCWCRGVWDELRTPTRVDRYWAGASMDATMLMTS